MQGCRTKCYNQCLMNSGIAIHGHDKKTRNSSSVNMSNTSITSDIHTLKEAYLQTLQQC